MLKSKASQSIAITTSFATGWSSRKPREQEGDVKDEEQNNSGCQQLVKPLLPRDRGHNRCKAEDHTKLGVDATEHVPGESEILRRTEDDAGKNGSEEPAFMREVVLAQIDDSVPEMSGKTSAATM